jgi:hypothetical protein
VAQEKKTVEKLQEESKEKEKGHQKEIKQLVDILESSNTVEDTLEAIPDVSNSTLLDNYIKSVQKRIVKQQHPKEDIQDLKKEIEGNNLH